VTLLVAAQLLIGCTNDVLDDSYPTTSAAEAAGAVKRGWIPAWVPPMATDLREVHDVDSNQSTLSFSVPRAGWRPPASCRPSAGGEFSEPVFDRYWLPSSQDLAATYDIYSCPSDLPGPMLEVVAVHRDGQRVVHWRVLPR